MLMLLLAGSIILELLIYTPLFWKFRLPIIFVQTALVSSVSTWLLFIEPGFWSAVVAALSVVRILNFLRIAKARMHPLYLRQATYKTSRVLLMLQVLALGGLVLGIGEAASVEMIATALAAVQALVAVGLFSLLVRNIQKTRYRPDTVFYSDKELPTVSLLIPARNETADLEECLRSALASDYPKLEIIVLDDCSQLKTSDTIKKFAHDGVRFILGKEPDEKWLAKNHAYEKLSHEASGDLLLFCGVDVRFGSHAIRALVTELLTRDKQMISILPRRLSGSLSGSFLQPMRYWWELALPRKLLNKPAVLSTCWLIREDALRKIGGFGAVSRSIIPERFFARKFIQSNDYSFIRANDTLDIQTRKSAVEQTATALRVKYPQLSKRPELVMVIVLLEFFFLLGPFLLAVYGLIAGNDFVVAYSALAAFFLILSHVSIVHVTSPPNSVIALWNLPVAVLVEIIITVASMISYEFGKVEWKDRNICIPVMHVVPHLPKLADK